MAYIARSTFRSMGVVYLPGDVVEDPRTIRLFRTKLKYGIITGEADVTPTEEVKLENSEPPEQLSPPQIISSESTPPTTPVVGVVLKVGVVNGVN